MAVWTCPDCNRDFGAIGRSHMCSPGLTVERFLTDAPDFVEPVFRRVHEHLLEVERTEGSGGLIVDPLAKKALFKNGPTFCILDVKTKWAAVGFTLRRKVESARMSRKTVDYAGKFFHVVNVTDPSVIDDEFRSWLTEAFHHGSEPTAAATTGSDPMVPDDIDFEIAPPR